MMMFCRCCLVYSTATPLKDVPLYSDKKAVLGFKTRYAFPRCTCLSRGGGEVYSSLTDAFALKIGPSFHSPPTQNCHQRMIRGSSLSIKRFWTICLSET